MLYSVREKLRNSKKDFNKTEDDLKSFQSVGQIVGEVLRPLDDQRSKIHLSCILPMMNLHYMYVFCMIE